MALLEQGHQVIMRHALGGLEHLGDEDVLCILFANEVDVQRIWCLGLVGLGHGQ